MNLSDSETRIAVDALYSANSTYREAAKVVLESNLGPDAKKRLIEQFEKQQADCTALIEKLESAE